MVVKIPKKLEMKSLLPAPCSPLPAHVLAFPVSEHPNGRFLLCGLLSSLWDQYPLCIPEQQWEG
jgi:hypothetical protein